MLLFLIGYSYGYSLDPRVVLLITGGTTGTYEFWMQPSRDGCSGYLHPGWMEAS
jgi:hypothetical protein